MNREYTLELARRAVAEGLLLRYEVNDPLIALIYQLPDERQESCFSGGIEAGPMDHVLLGLLIGAKIARSQSMLPVLSDRQHAAILAALRWYADEFPNLADPEMHSVIMEIATNAGAFEAIEPDGNELIQLINLLNGGQS